MARHAAEEERDLARLVGRQAGVPRAVSLIFLPQHADEIGAQREGFFRGAVFIRPRLRARRRQVEVGKIRVVARADNHLVLGIQAVGQGVSELAAAFGLALEMGARLEDIAGTIHAHPTEGEAFQEAALKALGQELHI